MKLEFSVKKPPSGFYILILVVVTFAFVWAKYGHIKAIGHASTIIIATTILLYLATWFIGRKKNKP